MTPFDRFAAACGTMVSRPWFFVGCVLLVVLWGPSYFLLGNVDTWQLVINTATTIITFLMVALLQNSQQQDTNAIHVKLDALAQALRDLDDTDDAILDEAIGAEKRTGATS